MTFILKVLADVVIVAGTYCALLVLWATFRVLVRRIGS